MADYVGELLLFALGGVHETFKIGENTVPAARCNAVVLSGPQQGREWTDALLFAIIALDQFRAEQSGSVLLGRVRARRGANNRDMYYIDNDVTAYDDQIAQSWNAAYPGKLAQLAQQAVVMWQAEEIKLHSGQSAQAQQAAPPPPPPPPPPVTQGFQQGAQIQPAQPVQEAPAAAPPPWGTTPQTAPAAAPPVPPSWPAAPAAPNAHILGGPAAPGDTSTPPY
jgi:hypothetical protein